ncbi:MAG: ArsC/Spx/MgsR family protein, partial [Pseudomonadota bacterium]
PSALQLQNWSARIAWQSLLNTRGSTWRKLDAAQRSDVNEAKALALMVAYPSLIKRPLLDDGVQLWLGFSVAQYTAAFLAESAHARES